VTDVEFLPQFNLLAAATYGRGVFEVLTTATLTSIAVTPASPSIAKGLTQQFTATGTYSDNSTQDLTSQVTWASATTSVATITAGGLATGVATGSSTISATSGSIVGSTVLTVTAAVLESIAVTPAGPSIAKGATQQFTATGTYSDNSTQNLTNSVTWASATTSVATITSAGLATGVATGSSTISATLGGVTGSTTLTVTAAVLESIAVTPASPTIAKGAIQQFTATGTYSDNSTKDLTSHVTWASATPAVATINRSGLARTLAKGTTVITASLNGVISPGDTLTVTAPALVFIVVIPFAPTISVGSSQQFIAIGIYTDFEIRDITNSVVWASSNPSVATIGAKSGLARGLATGTTQITATLGGVTSLKDPLTVTNKRG
jgi:uncharacterized protein YjdB